MFKKRSYHALKTISCDHCLILCYHRIIPKEKLSNNVEPGMYVTPSTFRTHIHFLKNFFEIATIDQMENYLKQKGNRKFRKPCCVISFDDGWLDFYLYAWPILKEENVPAVVYLPTNIVGTEINFWTNRLAKVIEKDSLNALTINLRGRLDNNLFNIIISRRKQISTAIALLKEYPYWQIEHLLESCEGKLGIQNSSQDRSFMNWDEIRNLFNSGLVSFGSHTANHAILTTLSTDEIQAELSLSQQKLIEEKVVNKKNISFCYPNGNYTMQISKLVDKTGYSSAMTCDPGWNKLGTNLLSLKRISLHQDVSLSKLLFAYRLAQYL